MFGKFLASPRYLASLLAAGALVSSGTAFAQAARSEGSRFVTLGTMGGPVPDPARSQPANVIVTGGGAYLVDVGDGAVEQLAKAGIAVPRVKAVVISHLHFDHTGGLAALLGLRYQINVPGQLMIYGPPGTKVLVAGIVASMVPGATAGYGLPGAPYVDPASTVEVKEVRGGDTFDLGGMKVTAAANTHYSFPPGSDLAGRFQSLSFRFELPDRVIAYTGDTGPSAAVERLVHGADLLVSEMIDVDKTVAKVHANTPDQSADARSGMITHLETHHLTPLEVGQLAATAQVKAVVITHFVAPGATGADELGYLRDIATSFHGPVMIAHDLDSH